VNEDFWSDFTVVVCVVGILY